MESICKSCNLSVNGRAVFGFGSIESKICLMGRNPGRVNGPFAGPSGQKQVEGLSIAGILKDCCYLTNVLKCPVTDKNLPTKTDYDKCTQKWLVKELESLAGVQLFIAYGRQALHYFDATAEVENWHGKYFLIPQPANKNATAIVFITFALGQILRVPEINTQYLEDMLKLGALWTRIKHGELI